MNLNVFTPGKVEVVLTSKSHYYVSNNLVSCYLVIGTQNVSRNCRYNPITVFADIRDFDFFCV